jgi:hypothetical protein
MVYEPRELPIDVAHPEGFSRYPITRKHGGNAATLRHYWTKGEGLVKWAGSPTPFRTLVSHLVKYVKDPEGLAAEYYHDVFGHWPGPKFGKGGKGKRK